VSDYDFEQLFAVIDGAVKSDQTAAEALASVVDYCAHVHKSLDWKKLRALDIDSDITSVATEVASELKARPIPAKLDGLYFGLFNPIIETDDGKKLTTAGIYLAANPYDNDDPDWACSPSWQPAYLDSQGLHAMHQIAYPGGKRRLGVRVEHPVGLAYGALLARGVVMKLGKAILGKARSRTIVVGFDSGDFLCLGRLDARSLWFSTRQDRFAT
jgi:hypothetical protein